MTTPYTSGQITLTNGSAIVTGVGTAWALSQIAGGIVYPEALGNPLPILPDDSDGINAHPITNTQLTAAVEWAGLSGTYDYAIILDTAYLQQVSRNATILAELIAGLQAGILFKYDVAGALSERATYNERPKGFAYLAIDSNPARLYIKASATSGDWAGPFSYGTGPQGATGPQGELGVLNPRGNYSASVTYARNDMVYYNGNSYVALQLTLGVAPPTSPTTSNAWWTLVALKGTDGTGIGDMVKSIYDPQNKQADAFDKANFSGDGRGASMVFDGDSLTAGYSLADPANMNYARQFYNLSFSKDSIGYFNYAVSGDRLYIQISGRYATSVKPNRPTANGGTGGRKAFLFVTAGTNDLVDGRTSAQIITDITNYIATAKADGFTVIWGTITPSTYNGINGWEEKRMAINAAIRRNDVGADIIWDMESVLQNSRDTAIFPDGGHYSFAASVLLARQLNLAMEAGKFPVTSSFGISKNGVALDPGYERAGPGNFSFAGATYAIVKNLGLYRRLKISGFLWPSTESKIILQFSKDNAATVIGTGYSGNYQNVAAGTSAAIANSSSAFIDLSAQNNVGANELNGMFFELEIDGFGVARRKNCLFRMSVENSSSTGYSNGGFKQNSTDAMDSFYIYPTNGSAISGDILVEGSKS